LQGKDQEEKVVHEEVETDGRRRLDKQLEKLEKEKRRSRSRSRSQSPTTQALIRAAGANQQELDQKRLNEARLQYRSLKADLMKFKREDEKLGSNLDETNLDVQVRFTPLALQRQRFLNQMKNTKHRENETMAKFNDFVGKLKDTKNPKARKKSSDDDEAAHFEEM
jgi:hypothetical protein